MPEEQRLTTSSDEKPLGALLGGGNILSVPYFQRAYKWRPDKLKQLEADLLNVVDAGDSHFLGAIILYLRSADAIDANVFEVIDGQQRLTTVFIYVCAIVRTLSRRGLYEEATGLFTKYLVVGKDTRHVSNSALHSCKEDQAQVNHIFADLLSDRVLSEKLAPWVYKPLPATGSDRGRLWNNYRAAMRFLEEQLKLEGVDRIHELYNSLLQLMTLVLIIVRNPTDGPKIFDSLNSHQEPMTTGDLVRNEVFSKAANRTTEEIEAIDQASWQPFFSAFRVGEKTLFDAYFFPYGLIQDPNVKKSEVYGRLRTLWKDKQPETIIPELASYQNAFLDVACGTNKQGLSPVIHKAFARLHEAGAPGSTYPFLMQLSNAVRDGDVTETNAAGVLAVVESFLVRRAICGHEPTGLHAVFKRLWLDCDSSPTREKVKTAIKRHRTVVWPSDDDLATAIASRALYGASITRYVLLDWNRGLGGDQPTTDPWIEHVLPEKPADEWWGVFTREQHAAQKDLLGNLLPLSEEMNRGLGNRAYRQKRTVYLEDSGFKAARKFAEEFEAWTPDALAARSQVLARWAADRWTY